MFLYKTILKAVNLPKFFQKYHFVSILKNFDLLVSMATRLVVGVIDIATLRKPIEVLTNKYMGHRSQGSPNHNPRTSQTPSKAKIYGIFGVLGVSLLPWQPDR